jgi:acetolactate synthase small subunit
MLLRIKELLNGKGISAERIEQAYLLIKGSGRYPARMPSHYLAVAIELMEKHRQGPGGVEIYISPGPAKHALGRPSVTFAVLALDWPGLLNSCAGTLHEKGFNIPFCEAVVIKEPEVQLGLVFIEIEVERPQDFENLRKMEDEIKETLLMAAARETGKDEILMTEARKAEHYSRVVEHLKRISAASEYVDLLEKRGEAVRFFAARSLAYLIERSPEDIAGQIYTNYVLTKMVRETGKIYARIANIQTAAGELTGISVAGYEHDLSLGDCFRVIDEVVPGHQRKYDKAFITGDGINVFRIEILDAAGKPLVHDQQVEINQKLGAIKDSPECNRLSPGVEMIGRKICPAMLEEERQLKIPQVYMHPHSRSNIKVVLVTSGADRGHAFQAIEEISKVRGLEAAMPDTTSHVTAGVGDEATLQEVAIIDVWVNFEAFFGSPRGPYDDEVILVRIEEALRKTEFVGPRLRIFDRTGRQLRRARSERIVAMAEKDGMDAEVARQILARLGDRQIIAPAVADQEIYSQVLTGAEAIRAWQTGGRAAPGVVWRTTESGGPGRRASYSVFAAVHRPERMNLADIMKAVADAGLESSSVIDGPEYTLVLFRLAHHGKALVEMELNRLEARLVQLLAGPPPART